MKKLAVSALVLTIFLTSCDDSMAPTPEPTDTSEIDIDIHSPKYKTRKPTYKPPTYKAPSYKAPVYKAPARTK